MRQAENCVGFLKPGDRARSLGLSIPTPLHGPSGRKTDGGTRPMADGQIQIYDSAVEPMIQPYSSPGRARTAGSDSRRNHEIQLVAP